MFAEHVWYNLFPLSNSSKVHVQELVREYYAGNEQPRTWGEINTLVRDMFPGLHQEMSVSYDSLYGTTDICAFPLLVKEFTSPRSIYQLLALSYLSLLQLLNLLLLLLNSLTSLTDIIKTDFPHDIVQLSVGLTTLTTTPLLIASVLHNARTIDITYYYTTLALGTLVALALSNTVLLCYLVYKRCTRQRYRVKRYPSLEQLVGGARQE
jgi:hypothetical protein